MLNNACRTACRKRKMPINPDTDTKRLAIRVRLCEHGFEQAEALWCCYWLPEKL